MNLSGTINASAGAIAGFSIETYGISNITDNAYVLVRNSSGTRDARIGSAVFPVATSAEGVGYFVKSDDRPGVTNIALYALARNNGSFGHSYSLWSDGLSYLPRIRHNAVIINGGGKLTDISRMFIHDPSTDNDQTVYLPDINDFEEDEEVTVVHYNFRNTYVKTDDSALINSLSTSTNFITLSKKGDSVTLMKYSGTTWVVIHLRGSFLKCVRKNNLN